MLLLNLRDLDANICIFSRVAPIRSHRFNQTSELRLKIQLIVAKSIGDLFELSERSPSAAMSNI
jgi:hypothetical protein